MNRARAILLAAVVLVATVPAPVAAETRAGGTVVVERGEVVNGDLEAFGGTVVVRGRVTGGLTAFSGNVLVANSGAVGGDVEAAAGNVRVNGNVSGNVEVASGNFVLGNGAAVGGQVSVSSGYAQIEGRVDGDVRVASERLVVGPTAAIGGSLVYDVDELDVADAAQIAGQVRAEENLFRGGGPGPTPGPVPIPSTPTGSGVAFGFLTNLLLGAVLLLVFPEFSEHVADRVTDAPGVTAGIGLLVLVAVPVVLVLFAITIIGLPITIAGAVAYVLALWVSAVYGGYAVGSWLLDAADADNRWLALVVGLLVVAILGLIPILGGVLNFVILLLGLGALATNLRRRYRGRGRAPRTDDSPTTAD